jgi:sugar-specific transcriptional regulator TrmB
MDIQESLVKLGLSETEAKIYLALIMKGPSSAVQISKEIDVHRRTIYDNLSILKRRGLVNFKINSNVKYFEATSPEILKVLHEEKNQILSDILPSLKLNYAHTEKTPEVNVFIGLNANKSIIEEALQTKQTIYWMGGGYFFPNVLNYSRKFIEEKIKKMNIKMIQVDRDNTNELKKIVKKANIRLLPKEYSTETGYLVYGNKVAIGIIQGTEVTTVVITSKECSKAYKHYFDIIWKVAKPIKN